MTDIATWITQYAKTSLTAGLEWAQAVSSLWCPPALEEVELSGFIDATPDGDCDRILSVAAPFRRIGAPSDTIDPLALVLVPGILRAHATRFRVGVKGQNYSSGTYRGRVRLTSVQVGVARQREMDVTVDV